MYLKYLEKVIYEFIYIQVFLYLKVIIEAFTILRFFHLYLCICVCVLVSAHTLVCLYIQKPGDGFKSTESGVLNGFKEQDVGAGSPTTVLYRNNKHS